MIGTLWQDIRYGARMIFKNPGVTFVIVLTLALGVGASTAIFSVVNAVLLRPLPYGSPERIVGVRETLPDEGSIPVSYRSFAEWRDRNTVFEHIAGVSSWEPNLEGGDEPVRVSVMRVSSSYFAVMGLQPAHGRAFLPEDDRAGGQRVVVISHELWQQRFGGNPNAIGQPILLDGVDLTVVGVMPPALAHPEVGWSNIWMPLRTDDQKERSNPGRNLKVNARLKPGVTVEQARADLERIMGTLRQDFPETHGKPYGVDLRPLEHFVVPKTTRTALLILLGAVACVLLIACFNVANLLLARAVWREREIGIRTALGASRGRVIRQLLTESLVLSLLGAGLGLLLAHSGVRALLAVNPEAVPRLGDVGVDATVLGFALLVTLLTAFVFGLAPALATTKVDLSTTLKEGGRGAGRGHRHRRLRNLLVVSEVAIAVVLLIASGLLVRSYTRLSSIKPGFSLDNVLTMEMKLPARRYREPQQKVNFFRELLEHVKALPGVTAVGAAQSLPLRGPIITDPVFVEDQPVPPAGQEPHIRQNIVTSDFFRAMGIPLVKGRYFTEQETWETGGVLIVNEAFARRFFGGEDPVGKRIRSSAEGPWRTVVGVAADTVQDGFEGQTIEETFYPYVNPGGDPPLSFLSLVIRTGVVPESLAGSVRGEIRRLDSNLPVSQVLTTRALADKAMSGRRLTLLLLGTFAGVALVLAAVGIYGVMSYTVSQRTNEIGIRMALGAGGRNVLWLILGHGLRLTLVGVAVGLAIALLLTRVLESLLYGVSRIDLLTYAGVATLLTLVALLACYVPARRATRVDPLLTLRQE
ncbi:MAG: ABC transporter permease [Acidobacteria bacterium]|nr:ABC transporter permease [Acidobacteriota bacterium]MCA1618611.1 ABC transporter permease [Acidobacteriota bacterium]